MNHRISFFGGQTQGSVTSVALANGKTTTTTVNVSRGLGFDRDIDGRWLVWAEECDALGEGRTGAMVVKNRDVAAFLERLGNLITEPAAFEHEPVFLDADDTDGMVATRSSVALSVPD